MVPGLGVGDINTRAQTTDRDYYEPFHVDTPISISVLGVEVTTASAGNIRIGIYRADANLQPIGAPLADSGNLDTTSTGVKTYTPGSPIYLRRGRYLGIHNCSASITLRTTLLYVGPYNANSSAWGTSSVIQERYVSRAFAAFPTPGTAWTTTTGGTASTYSVLYRVSTP